MPIGNVSIYCLLFVFCLFVRLRIYPLRIKLVAMSNSAWWFIGVQDRVPPILGNFAPQKPKIGQIGRQGPQKKLVSNLHTMPGQKWTLSYSNGSHNLTQLLTITYRPLFIQTYCILVLS